MGVQRVTVVDPFNLKQVRTVLKEELAAEEPSVIIARRPCALLKTVKHNPPLLSLPKMCWMPCMSGYWLSCHQYEKQKSCY